MRGMICPRCQAIYDPASPEVAAAVVSPASPPPGNAPLADPRSGPRCSRDGWRLVDDRLDQVIAGRFMIDGFLGVGGGGSSVWRASELRTGTLVALKLIPAREGTETQRFERGARLAAELDHPNLVRLIEHGRYADLRYVVMELLEGETVQALLARCKLLSPRDAVALADPILDALAAAHARGIVHRDLKPSNLFVLKASDAAASARPHVKILDFGIAKMAPVTAAQRFGPFFPDDDLEAVGETLDELEVTGKHRICGTPEYMAPEQILGGATDPRSDLYAVGLVLYRLLTGNPPFRAKTRFEMYHRHLHDAPASMPEALGIPPALEAVIARALAKKAEDRFPDALMMRQALLAAVDAPAANVTTIFSRLSTREYARIAGPDGGAELHVLQPPSDPEALIDSDLAFEGASATADMAAPTVVRAVPLRARQSSEVPNVQVTTGPVLARRPEAVTHAAAGWNDVNDVILAPRPARKTLRWALVAVGIAAVAALAVGLTGNTPTPALPIVAPMAATPTAAAPMAAAPAPADPTHAAGPADADHAAVVPAPLQGKPAGNAATPCP